MDNKVIKRINELEKIEFSRHAKDNLKIRGFSSDEVLKLLKGFSLKVEC